jgi:FkbM family methyltransferase
MLSVQRSKGRRVSIYIPCLALLVLLYAVNFLWFRMDLAIREKKQAEAKLEQAEAELEKLKRTSNEKLENQTRIINGLMLMQGRVQEIVNINQGAKILSMEIPDDAQLEVGNASGMISAASEKSPNRQPPGLPEACYNCRKGGGDGGVPLDENGVCRHFCSMGRFCGTTGPYRATDCQKPCSGSACLWQLSTPQTSADAFWIANSLLPFDRASRRFDFEASECRKSRGVDPQRDAIWIDVGAHDSAMAPAKGVVLAFEPQLWLWQKVVQQSRGNPCVFPIPAACAPGEPSFQAFHTSANYHSSSLLKVDAQASEQFGSWKGEVSQAHDIGGPIDFSVLTLSLEEVITRLPPCRRVEFLKIDAQGFDLSVAKSAGRWIRVVDSVEIETPVRTRGLPPLTPLLALTGPLPRRGRKPPRCMSERRPRRT